MLAFDWLSARAHHFHFVSVLKRQVDFELDFELFNKSISFQSSYLTELVGKFQKILPSALETSNRIESSQS